MGEVKSRLAFFGGSPAVPKHLQSERHPQIGTVAQSAVVEQLHDQISIYDNGGIYRRLESAFADAWNLRSALTVNSGTSALFTMFYGAGLQPGDEVIVPGYTFFATATPLFPLGVTPVLADCLENGNIDPDSVATCITDRTKAIACTHLWGIPCPMRELQSIATAAGLLLLEDASHAHGARYESKYVGSFADGAAWSLQGKKIVTAGEGGLYSTPHAEHYQRAVLIGHFNRRARTEVDLPHLKSFATTGTGLNFRMHPLAAALALTQVSSLERQLAERREVAALLTRELSQIDGLAIPEIPEGAEPAWYAFPLLYDRSAFPGLERERFVEALHAEGAVDVDIPGATCPLDRHALFRRPGQFLRAPSRGDPPASRALPGSANYHSRIVKLPCWYGEDRLAQADAYIRAIRKVADARLELRS